MRLLWFGHIGDRFLAGYRQNLLAILHMVIRGAVFGHAETGGASFARVEFGGASLLAG